MMQSVNPVAGVVFGLVVLILVVTSGKQQTDRPSTGLEMRTEVTPELQGERHADVEATTLETSSFGIRIRRPAGPPLAKLASDPQGRVAEIACSTCHSIRKPNFENTQSSSLNEFHQGLIVSHGKLACYACHHPDDADSLRSADGKRVSYPNVMTLCSQCHAQQADSYAHGAHGGMNGYWDLTRGPQIKNNCIDCHDPHAPSYPKMIVDFKPHDRFLEEQDSHDDH